MSLQQLWHTVVNIGYKSEDDSTWANLQPLIPQIHFTWANTNFTQIWSYLNPILQHDNIHHQYILLHILIPACCEPTLHNLLYIAFNRGKFLASADEYIRINHNNTYSIQMQHYSHLTMLYYSKYNLGNIETYINPKKIEI